MILGLLIFMFGTLFYGPISYGRLIFMVWFSIFSYIGIILNESDKLSNEDPIY